MGKVVEKIADTLRGFRRPKQIDLEEYLAKLRQRGLDEHGRLIPDPTPIAPPIGYKKVPSMVDQIREMVRSERLAQEARQAGMETFEESEDFDIGDDGEDLKSGFENDFDPPLSELVKAGQEAVDAKAPANPAEKAGEAGADGGSPNNPPPSPAPSTGS